MKRMLGLCLGSAVLLGALAPRGMAQLGTCKMLLPPEPKASCCQDATGLRPDGPCCQPVQKWFVALRPAARRELASNLLFAIHPLMAFLPTEAVAELPCDHPPQADVHYQIMPTVLRVVGPDGQETIRLEGDGLNGFGGGIEIDGESAPSLSKAREVIWVEPHVYGVTCPYLVAKDTPLPPPAIELPDTLANLQRLLQADQLMKRGEQLANEGNFTLAVDCFQAAHGLVPGTNLSAQANQATQNVLVRVYGTATESGLVDEQSEPTKQDACPDCDECPHCTKAKAVAANCDECPHCTKAKTVAATTTSASHVTKLATIVYPVADLLGKGKETRSDDLDELMNLLSTTIEPKSWAAAGGDGTMESYYRSRAIVIRQTSAVHEQITDVLAGLRQARAESEVGTGKTHASPFATRAVKGCDDEGCCEECSKAKATTAKKACGTGAPGCCDACAAKKVQVEANTGCPFFYGTGVNSDAGLNGNIVLKQPNTAKKACCASESGCCEEHCGTTVLTLPAVPTMPMTGFGLELEGVNDAAKPAANSIVGVQSTVGGACAEADASAGAWRVRWQLPLGPLTLLVRYENRELTFGLGTAGSFESAGAEESESPR